MISQQWHDFFLIGAVLLLMAALDPLDGTLGLRVRLTLRLRFQLALGLYGFIMAVYLLALLI
jgi:hypothetical protein